MVRDSPSVRAEPQIGFVTAGLALRYRRCSPGLVVSSFSDTFDAQTGDEDFGTVTLTFAP